MIIWQITDNKAGHHNQIIGLVQALRELNSVNHYQFPIKSNLLKTFASIKHIGSKTPLPDFIIAAGHHTHIPLLYARHKFGGHSIIIMKPFLPKKIFNTIIAPQHDNISGKNIITTRGALNKITPHLPKDNQQGLILIGGESKHFHWQNDTVINAIKQTCQQQPQITWQLTNSRRTPLSFNQQLEKIKNNYKNLQIYPFQQTNEFWLPQKLKTAHQTYVTNDSIAMIYEALTSQSQTHLIALQPKTPVSSLAQSINTLEKENYFTTSPPSSLNESKRVATIIYQNWQKNSTLS